MFIWLYMADGWPYIYRGRGFSTGEELTDPVAPTLLGLSWLSDLVLKDFCKLRNSLTN